MIPNLKVDIIYYNTQSDFEMEFNLSGYCRMRIFKNAASTKEELINTLAGDLDRSQIIIVVSNVLGENSGIASVSDAVGFELVSADKEECNIISDEEILIPKTAVPLVSKSGAFGGCILESGDQSIIMITDERPLRHEIMKSLVHQYIFDVSQIDAYKKRRQYGNLTTEETNEETPLDTEETKEPEQTGFSVPTVTESTIGNGIFSAPGTNLVINKAQNIDNDPVEPEDNERDLPSKKRKKKTGDLALLIVVILLLIAFGVMAYFFVYIPLVNGSLSLSNSDNGIIKAIETWLFS